MQATQSHSASVGVRARVNAAKRVNAWLGMACDVGVAATLLIMAVSHSAAGAAPRLAAAALLGTASFSFVEYAFHRWLFHGPIAALRRGHEQHHSAPLGDDALPFFLPPLLMLGLAWGLTHALRSDIALAFAAGVALGYAAYGLSHVVIHHRRFKHAMTRRWAGAHYVHHFHPERNFGVTSPLWDILLRTRHHSRERTGPSLKPANTSSDSRADIAP